MKKLRLFASLFIILTVSIISAIVCHADMVDDICEEFGYEYRWTVEVELDDTYIGTGLYEMSDDGKLQITYICLEKSIEMSGTEKDRRISQFCVLSGNVEFACEATQGYLRYDRAIVKAENGYRLINIYEEEHPLNDIYTENSEYIDSILMTIEFYRNINDNLSNACVIISNYRDWNDLTPIYIGSTELMKAEDTEILYVNRRMAYFEKKKDVIIFNYLTAKAVERDDKKIPPVPDEVNIDEYLNPVENEIDFKYDSEKFESAVENERVKQIMKIKNPFDILKQLDGRWSCFYYVSHLMGDAAFDIKIPVNSLSEVMAEIAPDGSFDVEIQFYTGGYFKIGEPKEGVMGTSQFGIISFTGSKGVGYAYLDFAVSAETPADGGKVSRLYTMREFDGNMIYVNKTDYPSKEYGATIVDVMDFPKLYTNYDDNGALCSLGFAYLDQISAGKRYYETYTVPISDVKIDEEAEITLTKLNLYGSEYLAKAIVQQARDERGAVDYNPDIMFIPVPEEPQGEPVLNPDLPLAPEEGDIRVTIGGRELSFDVAPMIENERVLVPLRAVFENLGADVTWDGETEIITITGNDVHIQFAIDKTDVSVNDETKYMDAPARIVEDRTLVPLRFLSEELGYTVTWDEESRLVTID